MIHGAISSAGLIAALALLVVSAAMNARFGFTLGHTDVDGIIYAVASAAADVLKAASPFLIAYAWQSGQRVAAMAGGLLFVVCLGYSLVSSLGYSALNRAELASTRTHTAQKVASLQASLKRAERDLASLGAVRSSAEITADMSAAKLHRRWRATDGCSDVTATRSIRFCQDYLALQREASMAARAAALRQQVVELQTSLGAMAPGANPKSVDPQAGFLRRLSGFKVSNIEIALILMVAALIEVGSGVGPYLATSNWRVGRRKMSDIQVGYADDFIEARLFPRPGGRLTLDEVYRDYEVWATQIEAVRLRRDVFEADFLRWGSEFGLEHRQDGDVVLLIDVQLGEA